MPFPTNDQDGVNPQWIKQFFQTALVLDLHESTDPLVAVGGFVCDNCEEKHVIVGFALGDQQVDMHTNAAGARELAASLIQTANRIDPNGGLNG